MITAVVLTKNEEKNIVDCLESLKFCDEVLVIDDYSDDRTVEIAKSLNAKVIKHGLSNNFAAQRNFGLGRAKGEWVLFVDADERINLELAKEIIQKINSNSFDGYYINRDDTIWGRKLKYGETGGIKLLRLGKKGLGVWEGKVHEEWKKEGRLDILRNHLDHYPHQTVAEFLREINYYSDLRVEELYLKHIKVSWYSVIIYPKIKFFLNYFLRLGILDGIPGLVFAIMMSFHSFLVRGKLWQLNRKKN